MLMRNIANYGKRVKTKHKLSKLGSPDRTLLYSMRNRHGVQFLLDLYILAEMHIEKYPQFDLLLLRNDITHILNQSPKHRLIYDES